MTDATHGGKGDRDRTDRVKFENNWDKVFGRKDEAVKKEKPLTQVQIDRKLKEWGMMYDCLQNIHLYDYPVQEAKALLKQIKIS
jgi:hypothetical protein